MNPETALEGSFNFGMVAFSESLLEVSLSKDWDIYFFIVREAIVSF